ncbi:hypothetical protein Aperf_G00000101855 [Anoplocephala perfoliata]
MSEKLNDEVKNFFAEVEAMSNNCKAVEANVPRTNWIVQVDPKTNLPYYCNYVTKETTWNIPNEYQDYLTKYQLYLQEAKPQDISEVPKPPHQEISPEGNARKRRRIKRARIREKEDNHMEDGPIEFLSEYIAYSNTSSSSTSNSVSENEPNEPHKSPGNEVPENEKTDADQQADDVFIGPRLPSPETVETDPVSAVISLEVPLKVSPKLEYSNRSSLLETSQILIEKFTAIDIHHDKFSPLEVAYVQFATRYEDWKYGYLSNERYSEKLEEVKDFLLQYEQDSLPEGCMWNPGTKRYIRKSETNEGEQECLKVRNDADHADVDRQKKNSDSQEVGEISTDITNSTSSMDPTMSEGPPEMEGSERN